MNVNNNITHQTKSIWTEYEFTQQLNKMYQHWTEYGNTIKQFCNDGRKTYKGNSIKISQQLCIKIYLIEGILAHG